jgi:hypothetical protein
VQTLRRRRGAPSVAIVATIAVVLAACGTAPLSPPPSVEPVASVEPLAPAGVAKLDPASRALLETLDTAGWAKAALAVTADAAVRRAAVEAGLEVTGGFDNGTLSQIGVQGPLPAIFRIAVDPAVESVFLQEDDRAMRPISSPLPAETVFPVPAPPYVGRALVIPPDQRSGAIPAGRAQSLLAALEREITTIDGEPYSQVQSSESCEPAPVTCQLSLVGGGADGSITGAQDHWEARLVVTRTGVVTTVIDSGANSLPRWLAREAERIARSDASAALAIARYTTVSSFRWASGGSLVIFVEYARTGPCQATGRPRAGDCTDTLTVAVDPAAATVLDIAEVLSR